MMAKLRMRSCGVPVYSSTLRTRGVTCTTSVASASRRLAATRNDACAMASHLSRKRSRSGPTPLVLENSAQARRERMRGTPHAQPAAVHDGAAVVNASLPCRSDGAAAHWRRRGRCRCAVQKRLMRHQSEEGAFAWTTLNR